MRLVTMVTVAAALAGATAARAQAPYLVKDIWPGPDSSGPRWLHGAKGRVYFSAFAGQGTDLWFSEGTGESTSQVTAGFLPEPPVPVFTLNDDVFFTFFSTNQLWRSDGTLGGTRRIEGVRVAPAGALLAHLPDRILFAGDDRKGPSGQGYPVITDGTDQGSFLVTPPLGAPPTWASQPAAGAPFGRGFGLTVLNPVSIDGGAWWIDAVTGRSIELLKTTQFCYRATVAGGRLFFRCTESLPGNRSLAVSDGTPGGTHYLPALALPPGLVGGWLFPLDDGIVFAAGAELWRSDGTPTGTTMVAAVPTDGLVGPRTAISNGVLYFAATTPATGRELWRTDGTPGGTFMLRDIEPGTGSGLPSFEGQMVAAGGRLFFAATTTASGAEVWTSDGTTAGTVALPEIVPGPGASTPGDFASAEGRVYFSAEDAAHGRELWGLDARAGAVMVDDAFVNEGDAGSAPARFLVRLESAASAPVVVSYETVAGTAQAGSDFTPQRGAITFAPGERERIVDVAVAGDLEDEANEAFGLRLTPVGGAVIVDGRADGLILDDDAPSVRASSASVVEGNSGTTGAVFDITLETKGGPSASSSAVRFAASAGTATAGEDFVATHGTVTFPPGSASGTTLTASIPVLGDTIDEPDETFALALDGQNEAEVTGGPAVGVILDDDGVASARPLELAHGTTVRGDLAPFGGPGLSRDFYLLQQHPEASYELVVDEASGDAAPLTVQRIAADGSTVLQSAVPVGTGTARSLRWINSTFDTVSDQHVRVESASCGTVCGTDDTYRVRFYETTLRGARVNTTNGQSTVLLLQNLTDTPVLGLIHFRTEDGVNGGGQPYSIPARGTLVHDMSQNLFLPGSLWVTHDAPYGAVAGKVVGLEPATGFSFDTRLTSRPR